MKGSLEPWAGSRRRTSVKRGLYLLSMSLLCACGSTTAETQPNAPASLVSVPEQTEVAFPTEPPSTTLAPSGTTSTSPEIDIVVAAAVARLTTKDNSFGGSAVFDRVNIVDRYGSPNSDGFLDVGSDSPAIEAGVRAAVEHALAPMSVTWVGNLSDVIGTGQDLPTYEEVGTVLTLSSPIVHGKEAAITTELWCGGTCGAGGTYTVEWTESHGWLVNGIEGTQWIA